MVKIVDNYVLEREIGKGQYGNVYKGYNKDTGEDIAVKVVSRKKLKGKFYDLLENEIKVLKTCKNNNIIRLYDIKKTVNNIYLILEYCNEGDLRVHLKEKGRLTEEQAIEILIQILNGFKTLIKNNIMHRDFKLDNILYHNKTIKIADFGFAKLLGNQDLAKTMLGSPLNMAPEVLGGKVYNNKADIWSIGICFYELIYGKPPFTGKNMSDLLNNIKTKNVKFNPCISISPCALDVIKRMLIVDVKKRIDWKDLFKHKINFILEEKMKDELQETLQKDDLIFNISRFYINNNRVIDHIADIEKKEDINNFAFEMAKNKNKDNKNFNGKFLKHNNKRTKEDNIKIIDFEKENKEENQDENLTNEETIREKKIKCFKKNSSKLLHERNKYVFLASVAEDAVQFNFENSDLLAYLLIKKLFFLINSLKDILENKLNKFQLEYWSEFLDSKEFKQIHSYILKEYDVFKIYFESVNSNVYNNYKNSNKKDSFIEEALKIQDITKIDKLLKIIIEDYIKNIIKSLDKNKYKEKWIHLYQILDTIDQERIFRFSKAQNSTFSTFNFRLYYEEIKSFETIKISNLIIKKFQELIDN